MEILTFLSTLALLGVTAVYTIHTKRMAEVASEQMRQASRAELVVGWPVSSICHWDDADEVHFKDGQVVGLQLESVGAVRATRITVKAKLRLGDVEFADASQSISYMVVDANRNLELLRVCEEDVERVFATMTPPQVGDLAGELLVSITYEDVFTRHTDTYRVPYYWNHIQRGDDNPVGMAASRRNDDAELVSSGERKEFDRTKARKRKRTKCG